LVYFDLKRVSRMYALLVGVSVKALKIKAERPESE
jgi:hypothetical protein